MVDRPTCAWRPILSVASADPHNPANDSLGGTRVEGRLSALHLRRLGVRFSDSNLVLIAGGWNITAEAVTTSELFDSATETFSVAGSMSAARISHTATLLCELSVSPCIDDRVLVAGGFGGRGENERQH